MQSTRFFAKLIRWCLTVGLGLIVLAGVSSGVRADSLKTDTALRWAPASSAFFSTSLRLQEQWQGFMSTRAYAKLASLPMTQMAVGHVKDFWEHNDDEGFVKAKQFWLDPSNKGLRDLLCDSISHEVFVYGDRNVTGLFAFLTEFNQQVNSMQWQMIGKNDEEKETAATEKIIAILQKRLPDVAVPQMAFGFRTTKADLAHREIDRLEGLAKMGLQQAEGGAFANRLTRVKNAKADMLTFKLDGSMIPWDKLKSEAGEDAEMVTKLADILSDRTIVIGLGIYDGYLTMMFSPEGDLTKTFASSDLLIDSPAFERVRSHADKSMVSIGYVSAEFMRGLSGPKAQLDQLVSAADVALPAADLDDALKDRIKVDVREMVEDLKRLIPTPGAVLGFTFLTKTGYEGFTENGTENFFLDSSKPLSILNHAGADPIIVAASRRKLDNPSAGIVSKWMHRSGYYINALVVEKQLTEAQKDLFVKFRDGMGPICNQLGEATKAHMKKAFQDGQAAFVLDARTEKESWHMMMPPAEQPLPMPEFGWVFPLTNRMEFEAGLQAYSETAKAMLEKLKQLVAENGEKLKEELNGPAQAIPDILPNVNLPEPAAREIADGKILFSPMLSAAGVDPSIAPCMGWNSDAMVFSFTPDTAERLLKKDPITGPLAAAADKESVGAASSVDVRRLVGMFRPWVAYGMSLAAQQDASGMVEQFKPQVDTVLEVLQCWNRYHTVTAIEKGTLVTHYSSQFEDLKE